MIGGGGGFAPAVASRSGQPLERSFESSARSELDDVRSALHVHQLFHDDAVLHLGRERM